MDEHSRKEKISESVQCVDGQLSTRLHLLGCCLLAQAHHKLHGMLKERKVCEAVRCFFRYLIFLFMFFFCKSIVERAAGFGAP